MDVSLILDIKPVNRDISVVRAHRAASSIPHSSLRPIFSDLGDSRDMFFLRPPVVSAGSRSGLDDCDRMVIGSGYSARAEEIMNVAI
jgi:hypothetical protein